MCEFKTTNDVIITNNQIEDILELVTGTLLNGATSNDEVSLFELGFLYDTNTETLLMTVPSYKWGGLNSGLHFSINTLSMVEVNDFYVSNEIDIIETMELYDNEWFDTNEVGKIFLLEQYNSWLSIKFNSMPISVDELMVSLSEYSDKYYYYM